MGELPGEDSPECRQSRTNNDGWGGSTAQSLARVLANAATAEPAGNGRHTPQRSHDLTLPCDSAWFSVVTGRGMVLLTKKSAKRDLHQEDASIDCCY